MKILTEEKITHPKAVIFDTDNTLYLYRPAHEAAMKEVIRKATSLLKVGREDFLEAFSKSRQEVKEQLKDTAASHSRLIYFQKTLEELGMGTRIFLTLDLEQTYWRTFLANTRLFDHVLDFLQLLKSDGVKTANITDLTAQIQFRKIVYFGLDEYFDYVVSSEEAGADKPDRKPFDIALSKLNLPPEGIWMIGDNPVNDIQGGNDVGLFTILKINNDGDLEKDNFNKPNLVVENYKDLITLYNSITE
jgi:FMN phosphatase YigB (HAD superfamily)